MRIQLSNASNEKLTKLLQQFFANEDIKVSKDFDCKLGSLYHAVAVDNNAETFARFFNRVLKPEASHV